MSDAAATGLREQKRAATRRALQRALLELAVERGFDHVTIEEVGRAAQVSPRTFFNYFASKEDAVVGTHPGAFEPSAERVAAFVQGGGAVLDDLVDLLVAELRVADERDLELFKLRKRLFEREPALLGRQIADVFRFEVGLRDLVLARLAAAGCADSSDRNDTAVVVASVAAAVVRAGWRRWVSAAGRTPIGDCLIAVYGLFRSADAVGSAARRSSATLDAGVP